MTPPQEVRERLERRAAELEQFAAHAEANRDGWFTTMPTEVSDDAVQEAAALRQAADRIAELEALLEEARGVLDAGTRSLDTARTLMLSGGTWRNSAGHLTDAALWIDRTDDRLRAFLSKLAPSSAEGGER